jgi:hypothetical protein
MKVQTRSTHLFVYSRRWHACVQAIAPEELAARKAVWKPVSKIKNPKGVLAK